jgi:membrane-associated protein
MNYRRFVMFNMIGGFLWAVGVTLAGYFLGRSIPDIDRFLLPIVFVIILVSVAPMAYHILKERENREEIRQGIAKLLRQVR